jgi:beta-ureidopropionase / N-carbamoyl-L-amino-acid hydrolase
MNRAALSDRISHVWAESVAFGATLFHRLDVATRLPAGVMRQSYGPGEQAAHDLVTEAARGLDLDVQTDAAGNLNMTLPARNGSGPGWLTGSHLDSVPSGGNFDGAAGVVAGLVVIHAFRRAGIQPETDITVIATRGEEGSSWFSGPHKSHFGGRAALGQLSADEMNAAKSVVDGRSLAQMIRAVGFDPDLVAAGPPAIVPASFRGFVELHIEQGPILDHRNVPAGIVSGIRGTLRARNAVAHGAYSHSGAVPREFRRDAVFAASEFAMALEAQWDRWLTQGRDVVCTLGRFHTDPEQHSLTKVSGEFRFTLDIRSEESELLAEADRFVRQTAEGIGERRRVRIDLGSIDRSPPAVMSADLRASLRACTDRLGIAALDLASGGGHDAANFAAAGIPTAMIFVRNPNGSHHPDEDMSITDFGCGARLLAELFLS